MAEIKSNLGDMLLGRLQEARQTHIREMERLLFNDGMGLTEPRPLAPLMQRLRWRFEDFRFRLGVRVGSFIAGTTLE